MLLLNFSTIFIATVIQVSLEKIVSCSCSQYSISALKLVGYNIFNVFLFAFANNDTQNVNSAQKRPSSIQQELAKK